MSKAKHAKKKLTIPDFVFSHAFNPLDAYRSHGEYTVGRSFEIGFISMNITSQLQYLGVSWEMQTVHIGTIIKPHSTQYSLTFRFQIDSKKYQHLFVHKFVTSCLTTNTLLGNVRREPKECLIVVERIRKALLRL